MRKRLFNAATKYVSEHGRELGLDPTRLAVAGESVGRAARQRAQGTGDSLPSIDVPSHGFEHVSADLRRVCEWAMADDSRNGVVLGCLRSQQGGPKEDDSIALVGNARTACLLLWLSWMRMTSFVTRASSMLESLFKRASM